MAMQKSKGEHKADVLLRVLERGRASARQAAVLLDVTGPTLINHIINGKVRATKLDTGRYYISVAELARCGLALHTLPEKLQPRIQQLLADDPLADS